jgi:hypothetical protein
MAVQDDPTTDELTELPEEGGTRRQGDDSFDIGEAVDTTDELVDGFIDTWDKVRQAVQGVSTLGVSQPGATIATAVAVVGIMICKELRILTQEVGTIG